MKNFLTALSRSRFPYEPLIRVEISKGRLLHNLNEFRRIAPQESIAPVLKSNAYGHGLVEVAEILEHEKGIPFFVVDSYFEAIALRSSGIKASLLVIGYNRPETMLDSKLKRVSFTVTSLESLEALKDARHPIHIHLKIDTGMCRQGISIEEIPAAMERIRGNANIVLEGICSHMPDADNADTSFTDKQIALWNDTAKRFKEAFPALKYVHLSNTDGHRFSKEITANVSRLGLGLYGLSDGSTFKPALDLQPVMEMKTIITGVKHIKKGDAVGYGGTFTAAGDMTIATIPAGYFEGVDRRLSNIGIILVGPEKVACPIIGRVSMNITTIDVSKVRDAKIGMEAIVISDDPSGENSMNGIAKKCGTISYEIAALVPAHLKRVVVE